MEFLFRRKTNDNREQSRKGAKSLTSAGTLSPSRFSSSRNRFRNLSGEEEDHLLFQGSERRMSTNDRAGTGTRAKNAKRTSIKGGDNSDRETMREGSSSPTEAETSSTLSSSKGDVPAGISTLEGRSSIHNTSTTNLQSLVKEMEDNLTREMTLEDGSNSSGTLLFGPQDDDVKVQVPSFRRSPSVASYTTTSAVDEDSSAIGGLQQQLAQAEIDHLRKQLAHARELANKVPELEEQIQQQGAWKESLNTRLEDCQAKLVQAQAENTNLRGKVPELEQMVQQLAGEKDSLHSCLLGCQAELAKSQVDSDELRKVVNEVPELERKVQEQAIENETLHTRLEDCQTQLSTARVDGNDLKELHEANRELTAQLKELNSQLSAKDSEIESLRQVELETIRLKHVLDGVQRQLNLLQHRKAARSKKEKEELESLQHENHRLREAIKDMTGQLSHSDEKNMELAKQLAAATTNKRQTKQQTARSIGGRSRGLFGRSRSRGCNSSSNSLGVVLEKDSSAPEAQNNNNKAEQNELEILRLQNLVRQKDLEINALADNVEVGSLEVREISGRFADLENQYEVLKDELAESRETNVSLTSNIKSLQQSLSDSKESLRAVRETMSVLEAENARLCQADEKIKSLRVETEDAATAATTEEASSHVDEPLWDLLDQIGELEQDRVELCIDVDCLQQQLFAALSAKAELKGIASARAEELDIIAGDMVELEERLQQEELENETLHDVLDKLRGRIAEGDGSDNSSNASNGGGGACAPSPFDKDAMISSLRQELEASKAKSARSLRRESLMRLAADNHSSSTSMVVSTSSEGQKHSTQQMDQDNHMLQTQVTELEAQLAQTTTCSLELENELAEQRAKIFHLSSTLDATTRNAIVTDQEMDEKCRELARVTAERDALAQRLDMVQTQSERLQLECERLSSAQTHTWDGTAFCTDENVKRLQTKYDGMLKRATDLSFQLATSHSKIDQLNAELTERGQQEEGTTNQDLSLKTEPSTEVSTNSFGSAWHSGFVGSWG